MRTANVAHFGRSLWLRFDTQASAIRADYFEHELKVGRVLAKIVFLELAPQTVLRYGAKLEGFVVRDFSGRDLSEQNNLSIVWSEMFVEIAVPNSKRPRIHILHIPKELVFHIPHLAKIWVTVLKAATDFGTAPAAKSNPVGRQPTFTTSQPAS